MCVANHPTNTIITKSIKPIILGMLPPLVKKFCYAGLPCRDGGLDKPFYAPHRWIAIAGEANLPAYFSSAFYQSAHSVAKGFFPNIVNLDYFLDAKVF